MAKAKVNSKEQKSGKGKSEFDFQIASQGETKVSPKAVPLLKKKFFETVIPSLIKEFGFKNPMQVPKIEKVVINCAVKEAVANPRILDVIAGDIMAITGQKPIITRAKKSIATFKVREGIPLGLTVTLRRARMYEFLQKVIDVALPRVRDFKGISPKSFDGRGNYSLGIKEHFIFPEVNYDRVDKATGFSICIVTSAKSNDHARALLTGLGMPFRN